MGPASLVWAFALCLVLDLGGLLASAPLRLLLAVNLIGLYWLAVSGVFPAVDTASLRFGVLINLAYVVYNATISYRLPYIGGLLRLASFCSLVILARLSMLAHAEFDAMPNSVCGASLKHAAEWWSAHGFRVGPVDLLIEGGEPPLRRLLLAIYFGRLGLSAPEVLLSLIVCLSMPLLRLVSSTVSRFVSARWRFRQAGSSRCPPAADAA